MPKQNKEYLRDAIAAIKILKQQSPLSEEDRGILLGFPGGGILKEANVFSFADKPEWLRVGREELRSLLTDTEWIGLQNSGLQNSHYTLPVIRQAMWEALLPLIPQSTQPRRVLDPGCGTAGFFWDMPQNQNLYYYGIDKEPLASSIAKRAMEDIPNGRVFCEDFLDHDPVHLYQAAIGNVPFVNGVTSMELDGVRLRISIHAQFFAKTVQCLDAGAPLLFLTSINTLDSRHEDYQAFRRYLHRKCEFLGAVRLPCSGVHHGRTEVTTDLILLRRRSKDSCDPDPDWIQVVDSDLHDDFYDKPIKINQWFVNNPQCLLGIPVINKLRGKNGNPCNSYALNPHPDKGLPKEIREALSALTQHSTHNKLGVSKAMSVTVIPADKFKSTSVLAFILRENPKKSGIEVHFHPNYTVVSESEKKFVDILSNKLGMQQAKSNRAMFFATYTEELMANLRKKVEQCKSFGAYEIDSDEPVEEIKPRYKKKQSAPAPATPTADISNSPIVQAIASLLEDVPQRVVEQIKSVGIGGDFTDLKKQLADAQAKNTEYLHRWQHDQEVVKELTIERDAAVKGRDVFKQEVEKLQQQIATIEADRKSDQEAASKMLDELGATINLLKEENESLKAQLAQLGITTQAPAVKFDEEDEVIAEVNFDEDEEGTDSVTFDEDKGFTPAAEPTVSFDEDETVAPSTTEETGFDLGSLGEL